MGVGAVSYNPLYLQVKDVLLKRILDAEYKPGDIIPTESKLAEDFGTSISTIRQACRFPGLRGNQLTNKEDDTMKLVTVFFPPYTSEELYGSCLDGAKQGKTL